MWPASKSILLGVFKNGVLQSVLCQTFTFAGATTLFALFGAATIAAVVSDTISVRVLQDSGSTFTLVGDTTSNYICVDFLGP